jgi:hypothetical protein
MIDEKRKPDKPSHGFVTQLQLEQDDLVIFAEDGKFYYVPKTYYANPKQLLPDKFKSTPEFVVGLGATLSDISIYPLAQSLSGASCIVLNLAALRKESEKSEERQGPSLTIKPHNDQSEEPSIESPPGLTVERDDLVIFGEDGKFYLVKKEYYTQEKQLLRKEMRSAPQLMVELGTVVADIPCVPTAGCACELVNLASLRLGSEEAARRARFQMELEQQLPEAPPEAPAQASPGQEYGESAR